MFLRYAELIPEQGEAVHLSRHCPVLLRLPDRPWGASASLPSAVVSSIAGDFFLTRIVMATPESTCSHVRGAETVFAQNLCVLSQSMRMCLCGLLARTKRFICTHVQNSSGLETC